MSNWVQRKKIRMIWKIIGFLCSLSFFITGFSVLGDPNCLSADFGGGRVIGVTCYSNSYGAFSRSTTFTILFLIGLGLLFLTFWNEARRQFENSGHKSDLIQKPDSDRAANYIKDFKSRVASISNNANESIDQITAEISYKTCDKCSEKVSMIKSWCPNCSGTSFTHKKMTKQTQPLGKTSEEAMSEIFSSEKSVESNQKNPEFKNCPMCAEEIKYAARKCRYCQHMMEE